MNKKIKFRVNGKRARWRCRQSLLVDCLRYDLGYRHQGRLQRGVCGACTVLMDGDMITSCLTLAVMVDGPRHHHGGGLAKNGELNPVQKSFISTAAFNAAFALPAKWLLRPLCWMKIPSPTKMKSRTG